MSNISLGVHICSSVNLLGWNWTLSALRWMIWVFCGIWFYFQILFKSSFSNFQLLPQNDNKQWKERRKNSESNFSKSFSCRKEFELEEYYLHSRQKKCQSRVSIFQIAIKSIRFFSSKGCGVWWDLLSFYVKFIFVRSANSFQSSTKARLQFISNASFKWFPIEIVFYGLSTFTDGVGGPCDWSRLRRDLYRVLLLYQSGQCIIPI